MKLIHLSDLHLGKRCNEFSMLEEQEYILYKIISIVDGEQPDGILIAGDVYDRAIPSTDAVELFDNFLVKLAKRTIPVFIISGNHDSPERLAFGNRLMDASGMHISPVYNGQVEPFLLKDPYGTVNIYLLPFVKPVHVRGIFPKEEIESYTDAVQTAIRHMNLSPEERNVLVTHQFVTGAAKCDSEEISVGGTDHVDASVFDGFDYVALGHIHGPQSIGTDRIRYCGTPLKYSFSEVKHEKSVTVVELKEKNDLSIRTVPLIPKHDMVELRGTFRELTEKRFYEGTTYETDYVSAVLTDEEDVPDAMAKLRKIYSNIMKVDYDNTRTRSRAVISGAVEMEKKSPLELFSEFYRLQNGKDLSAEQLKYMTELIETVWEDGE